MDERSVCIVIAMMVTRTRIHTIGLLYRRSATVAIMFEARGRTLHANDKVEACTLGRFN